MRLVLIRHCETDWNVANRMQGHTDIILNDHGRQQALDLCDQLESLGIARIYTSDLKRAFETAQIISLRLGAPVTTDSRLRECSFGKLEGLTFPEVVSAYPHPHIYPFHPKYYTDEKNPYDFTPYGGERKEDVIKRHLDFVEEMKKKYSTETILAIGHGTGFNTLLNVFGQEPNLKRGELRFVDF